MRLGKHEDHWDEFDDKAEGPPWEGEDAEREYFLANVEKCIASATDWSVADRIREEPALPGLIRCIVGNPMRPDIADARWQTPLVTSLALAAYNERKLPTGHLDPARLAVLSDALEEAGYNDAVVLEHLRSPEAHVRGCWGLDLILGKG
jgi:hypothetical protein